jgi:rubrerythrin
MKKANAAAVLIGILVGLSPVAGFGQSSFPQTIAVMRTVLTRELLAFARYEAYARKAREEGYPHIANLAAALSVSESIHARNFRTVLADLGCSTDEKAPEVSVSDTRTNIKNASTAELEEIDVRYPEFLAQIEPEKVPAAIDALTHAWEAEKEHRDLITQLISGSGVLFGLMARKIEGTPVDYFVCTACGSTLDVLPKERCPICLGPVSLYEKLNLSG